MALALDGNASIADGSQFFIPVRVMVDEDDVAAARRILAESA
ncbi:putative signal transducing protein [Sphingomonas sp. UYP23]